jgi:hypothetical protein
MPAAGDEARAELDGQAVNAARAELGESIRWRILQRHKFGRYGNEPTCP